jgi:hypothetical protein
MFTMPPQLAKIGRAEVVASAHSRGSTVTHPARHVQAALSRGARHCGRLRRAGAAAIAAGAGGCRGEARSEVAGRNALQTNLQQVPVYDLIVKDDNLIAATHDLIFGLTCFGLATNLWIQKSSG